MSENKSQGRVYFLGIEGERLGPFSEDEVLEKIRQGSVRFGSDVLVWYEGLTDWKAITSVDAFQKAFQESGEISYSNVTDKGSLSEVLSSEKSQPHSDPAIDSAPVGSEPEEDLSPVFGENDTTPEDAPFVRFRFVFITTGLLVLAAVTGGYIYLKIQTAATAQKLIRPKLASETANARLNSLRKAESELAINEAASVKALNEVITSNPNDSIAEQAATVLVVYYRQVQKPKNAAEILLSVKKYEEAAKLFLSEPGNAMLAQDAFFRGYEAATVPAEKRRMLVQNIYVLLGQGGDLKKAVERIALLHKSFPNQPSPFTYYTRSNDERIAVVFGRVAHFYVQSLLAYIAAEFPHLNLVARPRVEVRKSKEGNYRITGIYSGEVILNSDRIPNVQITLWLDNDQWTVVDTNITNERAKWAKTEREKLSKRISKSDEILLRLESLFQEEFPKETLYNPEPVRSTAQTPGGSEMAPVVPKQPQ